MAAPTVRERQIALIGNPNVGKSTLFNALTGSRQRVANYPGVTVDAREGEVVCDDSRLRLVDLPGTYSLSPAALDEAVVEGVMLGHRGPAPDVVAVVLNATNVRRGLFLLSEVIDTGRPVVVVLNMVDEARRAGVDVPTEILRETLGVPVLETVASEGEGVPELLEALSTAEATATRGWRMPEAIETHLSERSEETMWERLRALRAETPQTREQEVLGRYTWISEVLGGHTGAVTKDDQTEKIDRVLLHPVIGPVLMFVVFATVFQAIFSWAVFLMEGIEKAFGYLAAGAASTLPDLIGVTATSLVTDGMIGGVGAVVVFLPQIVILFLALGLLEDTGYMSRAAFLVDRPLRAFGLSGRSFIPMLSSFACAIPGVLATRTIPSKRERLLAILVAPLMTCSARLPVYVLLIATFVPATTVAYLFNLQGLVLLGLYAAGICSAALVALLRSRGRGRGKALPLVVELPPYRLPTLKGVWLKLRVRAGDFLKRAGTVIFAVSVALWFLMTFPQVTPDPALSEGQNAAVQLENSFAGRLGHAIEPVIRPLGYDWKIGIGLIASFGAREVFVGTMGVVYSIAGEVDEENQGLRAALAAARHDDTGKPVYTLATVFSLLAFYVFALQCGATVAVVKREANWQFALGQLVAFLLLAYISALATYQVMTGLGY